MKDISTEITCPECGGTAKLNFTYDWFACNQCEAVISLLSRQVMNKCDRCKKLVAYRELNLVPSVGVCQSMARVCDKCAKEDGHL